MRLLNGNLLLIWIVFAICFDCVTNLRYAQGDGLEFPYIAIVRKDHTQVRSGPASLHYTTELLGQGDTVQVHREDPNGWAAIRPTEGSFSLIPATSVELVDDITGRIITGGTQAWVGTREGAVDTPLWQVKLREDELVDILGEVSWPSPEGHSTIWFQISPPAGEFRWVKLSDLQIPSEKSNQLPEQELAAIDALQKELINPGAFLQSNSDSVQPDMPKVDIATLAGSESDLETNIIQAEPIQSTSFESPAIQSLDSSASEPVNQGWRAVTNRIDRDSPRNVVGQFHSQDTNSSPPNQFTTPSMPVDSGTRSSASLQTQPPSDRLASTQPEQFDHSLFPSKPSSIIDEATMLLPAMTEFPTGPIGDQLKQVDFRLGQEMIKSPIEWRLEDLKIKSLQLRQAATSEIERQFADRILKKIAGCEQTRARFRQAYTNSPTSNTILGLTPSSRPVGTGVDQEVEFGTTYDAHGWLNELKGKGSRGPTFVLQDDEGKITHHVSPAPGLNLRRYLKSRVGIIGSRGYHQAFNLDHVTAERIVELSRFR